MLEELDIDTFLFRRFGHHRFREGQRRVISSLLAPGSDNDIPVRRNAIAVFPTGAGKSLCYQLPAVALQEAGEGTALVVSPLISLMKDQIDALTRRGIRAARLDSSLSLAEIREVEDGFRSGELALLYVAPERFNNERFVALSGEAKISLFAVDEAHCISEWGHAFRPDYLKLARFAKDLGVSRKLALTATATPEVVEDVGREFEVPDENQVVLGVHRPNLRLLTTRVEPDEDSRLEALVRRLSHPKRPPGASIVYTTRQKTTEEVAEGLTAAGHEARFYHAGMAPEARSEVQEWWSGSDSAIVVATIAFGMGIDRADVRYVYHHRPSKSLEGYSQEVGRAGRDGEVAIGETFFDPADARELENYAYGDTPTADAVRGVLSEVFDPDLVVDEGSEGREEAEPEPEIHLNLYDLSNRHDVKQTVLKTLLAYLELDGWIRQGTPFYDSYKLYFPDEDEGAGIDAGGVDRADRADQVAGLPIRKIRELAARGAGSKARWLPLDADVAAGVLGTDRTRVVRAIGELEERGIAGVRAAGVRHRFFILKTREGSGSLDALAEDLYSRFERRELQEIGRVREVLGFAASTECRWAILCRRFGEEPPEERCGLCTGCLGRGSGSISAVSSDPSVMDSNLFDRVSCKLEGLREEHPAVLCDPRQVARFLTGLGSPAQRKAKLKDHELFGILEDESFTEVLGRCKELIGEG